MTEISLLSHGAHLVSAASPVGELLWLSPKAQLEGPKAIRGGVPIVGPWFSDLDGKQPSHGWARISTWEITEDRRKATLIKDDWELQVTLEPLRNGFELTYVAINHADESRQIQLAFHPYFRVGDVRKITIEGFDGRTLYDRVTGAVAAYNGPLEIEGEFDRIDVSPDLSSPPKTVQIIDPVLRRTITIEASGNDSYVIWNPGERVGGSMADVADQWSQFVCVEPAILGPVRGGEPTAAHGSQKITMRVQAQRGVR